MPKVFITGSGRRIGRGLALGFAGAGWDVAVHYNRSHEMAVRTAEEVRSHGVDCLLVRSDLRKKEEIKANFREIIDKFGVPDVLVNNAGVFPKAMKLEEVSEDIWDDVASSNLKSQFLVSREYCAIQKGKGRIINIGSLGGLEVWKNRIPYNVSKAGVIQLTKSLARELAPGITVNCVCPGTIVIPGEQPDDPMQVPVSRIPMARYGNNEDMFSAVYFFATCPDFITGQVLSVDGGYHIAR